MDPQPREALDAGPDQAAEPGSERRTAVASTALGALMVVAAVVVLVDAASLSDTEATVGPAAAPTLVGVLLGVVGAVLAARSVRDLKAAVAGPGLPPGRLLRLAAMVGLLLVFAVVLPFLGYVVPSAALFTGAALLLGAPSAWRALAYGWTLAALVFLVFDRLIGLTLPTGPWGF